MEDINNILEKGNKREWEEWLNNNCDFVSIVGTSAIAIYKGKGYEVYNTSDAVRLLLEKIKNIEIDYQNPAVYKHGYAPELYEFDIEKTRGW